MLINPTPSATAIANINTLVNPRQIAAYSNTYGQVMYTVPAGKKFVGYFTGNGGTNINIIPQVGVAVAMPTQTNAPTNITLVAGTVVSYASFSNAGYLLGVESDL